MNDLESGRYGGDFYPLTGREAFYLWGLGTTTAAANLYLNPDPAISSVLRSTSSIRYKHSVETIDSEHADLISGCALCGTGRNAKMTGVTGGSMD